MQFSTQIGQTQLLHNSGVGKALAAYMADDQLLQAIAKHGMPKTAAHTMTSLEEFKPFLVGVRETATPSRTRKAKLEYAASPPPSSIIPEGRRRSRHYRTEQRAPQPRLRRMRRAAPRQSAGCLQQAWLHTQP
ncbi:hypothetical protein D3H35_01340 [Cohnella faecalis]|uniref:IclR-ED domain-containing protein n=1 Tax=Cohnella faecalis TaxID=2315694 RepID=A0A398CPG9_9BACL|nr:hypothetical protein D3H35_01340 [Cohnella faecalis]